MPFSWKTAPSAMTSASVRLVTFATTYFPRISDDAMSAPSLDARVEHLDELLLLEGARDLGPEPLDEVRTIAFELRADHAARPRHVDRHAVQHAAGARREHDHAIRQIDGLVDVVGDEDDRLARAAPDVEQERLHLVARLHVERGERLVHQEDPGTPAQRARDGHPLLHAARQLVRELRRELAQADLAQELVGAATPLLAAHALQLEPEGDVVPGGQPRIERG